MAFIGWEAGCFSFAQNRSTTTAKTLSESQRYMRSHFEIASDPSTSPSRRFFMRGAAATAGLALGCPLSRAWAQNAVWFKSAVLDERQPELERIRHNLILDVDHLRTGDVSGLDEWRGSIEPFRSLRGVELLGAVNDFVNDRIAYDTDWDHYHVTDHWAVLSETVSEGRGDCEDTAIAKLESLVHLGWEPELLALMIGHLTMPDGQVAPHAVGACLHDLDPPFDPVILGNVDRELHFASERSDFEVAYAAVVVEHRPEWVVAYTQG